jgi:hypothetical protein
MRAAMRLGFIASLTKVLFFKGEADSMACSGAYQLGRNIVVILAYEIT